MIYPSMAKKPERNAALGAYYGRGHSIRECAIEFKINPATAYEVIRKYFPSLLRERGDTRNNSTGLTSGQRVARRGR